MPTEADTYRTYTNYMVQSATEEELRRMWIFLSSILERLFKGEL